MGSVPNQWDQTAGLTDRLVKLHASGRYSVREMMKTLSGEFHIQLTRNAIIGKLRRLELRRPPSSKRKPKPKPKPKPIPPKPRRVVQFTYYPPPPPPPSLPLGLRLSIYQLRDGMCRYPTDGTHAPYLYCGLPTEEDCQYCPPHCTLSRQTPHSPRKKRYQ